MPANSPGPSTLPVLSGTKPGIIDPTQSSRLLRTPDSSLSFASFDPHVATPPDVSDLRKLSLNEELYRPKRIVLETLPTGQSFWRFVPNAAREDGVLDEGTWPRTVELCGQLVNCTQEQWDIYKLDPFYECLVRAPPSLSTITRTRPQPREKGPASGEKRHSSPVPAPISDQRKKAHILQSDSSSDEEQSVEDEEEDEVIEMIVDDGRRSRGPDGDLFSKRRHQRNHLEREARRAKIIRRAERLQSQCNRPFDFSRPEQPQVISPEPHKRKVNTLFESLRSEDPHYANEDYLRNTVNYAPKYQKRTRTVSPSSTKRELEAKRLEREKQKRERREQEILTRRQLREQRFMSEILADVPEGEAETVDEESMDGFNSGLDPEEAERRAKIEESRRKLAQLEADRPLWEEEAKKRAIREKAEAEARQARAAAHKREEVKRQEERRAREQQEAEQRDNARQQDRQERARREHERQQRQQRWSSGPWTPQRALEKYKAMSEYFDTTKFCDLEPLTVDSVPWPVLHPPSRFSVEDVQWASVEEFFAVLKGQMRPQDFKTFVEKSHRRFHPDRWSSRSLLKSVVDEAERDSLEVAANTVAQALTDRKSVV